MDSERRRQQLGHRPVLSPGGRTKWGLAGVFFGILCPASVLGHTSPAVLELLDDNSVRVAHGLALRDGERFHFACPSIWGGPDAPDAASDGRIWVAGTRGVVHVTLTSASDSVLPADGVREVIAAAGQVFVLHTDPTQTTLFSLKAGPEPVWRSARRIDDAAPTSEGIALVTRELDHLEVDVVGPGGQILRKEMIVVDRPGAPTLHPTRSEWFISLREGGRFALGRVMSSSVTWIAESDHPYLGPVDIDEVGYVVSNGQLHRIDQNRLVPQVAGQRLTCLRKGPEGPYACVQTVIRSLRPGGVLGPVLFDLAQLGPPRAETPACQAEWFDLVAEAGLTWEAEKPPISEQSEDGCRCGGVNEKKGGRFGPWWLVWLMVMKRRSDVSAG